MSSDWRLENRILRRRRCARKAGVKAIENGKTKYSPNQGTVPLREAVCEKLKRENGVEYTPSEIVISNGAKQSVTQAVLTCCGPGTGLSCPRRIG